MKNSEARAIYMHLKDAIDIPEAFPIRVGFAVASDINILEDKLKPFNLMYNAILKKYIPEGKDSINPGDPKYEDAVKEINELSGQDIGEVELKKINMSDLDGVKLTLKQYASIEDIVEE